jgi:hypothetical protein
VEVVGVGIIPILQVPVDLVADLLMIMHLVQELLDKDILEELIMEIREVVVAEALEVQELLVLQVVMVVMDYEQLFWDQVIQ